MSSDLPLWFPFRKLTSASISEDTEIKLLIERVILLSGKVTLKSKLLIKDTYETDQEFKQRADQEILGHGILRLAATTDLRIASWLIEVEGDLFAERFKRAPFEEKTIIMTYFFGEDNIKSLADVEFLLREDLREKFKIVEKDQILHRNRGSRGYLTKDTTGLQKVFAIRYTEVPYLLKKREYILYKGWLFGTIKSLTSSIKRRFENQLNTRIKEIGEKIGERNVISDKANMYREVLQREGLKDIVKPRRQEFSIDGITIEGDIDSNMWKFPPCIQDLLNNINTKGYIGHWERFQLGIFLKVTGMDVEEQLRFWFSKAVDNVGMSFEEFKKRAGYIIRHIYGLEGGKIDYNMPSCSSIQDKMYCTFKHSSIDSIKVKLDTIVDQIDDSIKQQILKGIAQRVLDSTLTLDNTIACKLHLALLLGTGSGLPNRISHPLIYLKIASERYEEIVDNMGLDKPKKELPSEENVANNVEEIN